MIPDWDDCERGSVDALECHGVFRWIAHFHHLPSSMLSSHLQYDGKQCVESSPAFLHGESLIVIF
jgi:hypothetical protein